MRVVFVPGFMQREDAWEGVSTLVGERYPTLCVEHEAATADGRIREIQTAVTASDVPVGYSMGGRLVLHALVDGLRARGAVLVSCSAGIEDAAERARRREADTALAAWMEGQAIEEVVSRWERQPIFSTQAPDVIAAQRASRLTHAPAQLATLLRSAGQGAMEPVWERLPEIQPPILLIAGDLDRNYARAARRMAASLPNGRAELIPGAGHAPQLERPRETADRIVSFLTELEAVDEDFVER